MEKLKSELIKKTWEYVEEQAMDITIDYIKVFMPTNEVEKYFGIEICDMNGWQGDWWYESVQLGGVKWNLSGCMYNGTLELELVEDLQKTTIGGTPHHHPSPRSHQSH